MTFDTHDQVITWKASILAVTNPDSRSMPPAIPLADDDYSRLKVWLTCYE